MPDEREKAWRDFRVKLGTTPLDESAATIFGSGYDAGRASRDAEVEKQHDRKLELDAALTEALGSVEQLERMARWLSGSCNSVDTDEIGDVMLRVLDGEEWSPGMLNFEDEESDNG